MMVTVRSAAFAVCLAILTVGMLCLVPSALAFDMDNAVAAWLFNGDGTDSSGNGADGELNGDPAFVDGKFGQAVDLDGTDDWLTVPALGSFEQVTIATWAQVTGRVGQWRAIFTNDGWKAGDVHHQLYSNNVIGFSLHSNPGGNDSKSVFALGADEVDVWHHLATVYNSNEGWLRFYVDGALDVENTWGGNPAVLDPARVGSWDGGGREWQGLFDDFIIFDVALGEGDIQELMADGYQGSAAVDAASKLATSWGQLKVSNQ